MTTEEIFDIPPQPAETCPLVDKAQALAESALGHATNYDKCDEEELRDRLWRIESDLGDLVGYKGNGLIEEIRQANESIRNWGQEWKDAAKNVDMIGVYHEKLKNYEDT
tara:strand:+ start:23256 stop:23582 length:327 start_codon:yes stop_codon:yes gene_type:complete